MTQCTETTQVFCPERTERTSQLEAVLTWVRLQKSKRRHRKELAKLVNLPDYLLRDIGLNRYDVMQEARQPFWR